MTHENVFRNVILGKAVAGGSNDRNFDKEPEEVRSQLRILYEKDIPSWTVGAHPRVPERLRHAVIDAVLRFAKDKENEAMLKAVRMPKPMKADYKRDYLLLEGFELEKYVDIAGD